MARPVVGDHLRTFVPSGRRFRVAFEHPRLTLLWDNVGASVSLHSISVAEAGLQLGAHSCKCTESASLSSLFAEWPFCNKNGLKECSIYIVSTHWQ